MANLKSESTICSQCKGKHWNPNSQKETQASVLKEFGKIANNCVNGEGGVVHCPYAKQPLGRDFFLSPFLLTFYVKYGIIFLKLVNVFSEIGGKCHEKNFI